MTKAYTFTGSAGSEKAANNQGAIADVLPATNIVGATFDLDGTLLTKTSAVFTGNATLTDTSFFAIPVALTNGTYAANATVTDDVPNFATVVLDGSPGHVGVRIWKHDGTKEAQTFDIVLLTGAA